MMKVMNGNYHLYKISLNTTDFQCSKIDLCVYNNVSVVHVGLNIRLGLSIGRVYGNKIRIIFTERVNTRYQTKDKCVNVWLLVVWSINPCFLSAVTDIQ